MWISVSLDLHSYKQTKMKLDKTSFDDLCMKESIIKNTSFYQTLNGVFAEKVISFMWKICLSEVRAA